MDREIVAENTLVYTITKADEDEEICKLGRALSSPGRIQILRLLTQKPMNLVEIAARLNLPISSVAFHINALEEAKLVQIEYKPSQKGHMKLCSTGTIKAIISFTQESKEEYVDEVKVEMPVGNYVECNITKGYLVGKNNFIFREQSSQNMLFAPERTEGQLFSFQSGNVSYNFPNIFHYHQSFRKLSFSFEMCSEAPYYCEKWPSDITVWINSIEIATFCSPGDFGGKRGKYTPDFWQTNSTQFGLLKKFSIDDSGCYIDDILDNKNHTFDDLKLNDKNFIRLTIGIKDDAVHVGGINIFGRGFGNYHQDIQMILSK